MTNKELRTRIAEWMTDYEATQPGNVCMDDDSDDSFEGSAYNLLGAALVALKEKDLPTDKDIELMHDGGHTYGKSFRRTRE